MLSLLLDEQMSPEIAVRIRGKRPEISILSLYEWRNGAFIGVADSLVLRAASDDGLTLVTYDRKTIPPLLVEWGRAGISHGGVIFVDNLTIRSNDFGRLVRSLMYFWDQDDTADWTNGVGYLTAPPG